MTPELGHFALVLAFFLAALQSVGTWWGIQRGNDALARIAPATALAQFVCIAIAFAALLLAFATSDFSVSLVAHNSHTDKPMIYKLAATWGNHEGSMVLWVLILAFFGALVAYGAPRLPRATKLRVLAVQGLIGAVFLLFILLTSNPFLREVIAPIQGDGFNPVLQDPALAIHPPLLYVGYVGLSVSFAFAIAALWQGEVDAAWARFVRPWILAAWSALTIGIALGSWWAYYELGWGGWWFWDPVENASLMPWLMATALLHSAVVTERRETMKSWTVFLALAGFGFSLLGTFLVRSGVLTSVHAFATDPARGVFILLILGFTLAGSYALFAWRAPLLKSHAVFAPISRESALLFNNLFLTTAAVTILVGTLYPLVLEAITGDMISVGPPYFNSTVLPLMVPLFIAMPFGPLLAWKRGDLLGVARRLMTVTGITVGGLVVGFALMNVRDGFALLGATLGIFVIAGAAKDIYDRLKVGQISLGNTLRRALGLPRSAYGTALAHAGVGILIMGVSCASALRSDEVIILGPGDSAHIAGYEVRLMDTGERQGPNYIAAFARFDVLSGERIIDRLEAERRFYPAEGQATSEVGLHASLFGDLYVVLGDRQGETDLHTVTVAIHPLVRWIWAGALIMCLGGLISLSDGRFRIGAPRTAKKSEPVEAGLT